MRLRRSRRATNSPTDTLAASCSRLSLTALLNWRYTSFFLPRSLCRSRQKTPRLHSSSLRFTTSRAAVFSLTKRTRFPSARSRGDQVRDRLALACAWWSVNDQILAPAGLFDGAQLAEVCRKHSVLVAHIQQIV